MATTEVRTGSDAGGSSGSSAPWVAFLVGIVLVAAVVAAFFFFSGGGRFEAPTKNVNVDISAPKLPDVNLPEAPKLPNG